MKTTYFTFTLSLLTACFFAATVTAQTNPHAEKLKNYLTDDIAAVFYLDISKMQLPQTVATLVEMKLFEQQEIPGVQEWAAQIEQELQQLQQASVTSIYGLIRMEDFIQSGPHWVIPVENPAQIPVALERLRGLQYLVDTSFVETWTDDGRSILAGGQADWFDQIKKEPATSIRQLDFAWQALGRGSAGLLVMGDPESRNVTRFMMPQLPPPFEKITGKMVADEIEWAGLTLKIGSELEFEIVAQSKRPEVAAELQRAAVAGVPWLFSLLPQPELTPVEVKTTLAETLKPVVANSRVSIRLNSSNRETKKLVDLIQPAIAEVRGAAARATEMNNLRQLVIAFHNYTDAFRHFPVHHKDSDKKFTKLSWRVHLLPFIEQQELYEQFKLDQPWDSEHNIQLIDKMPEVYKSVFPEYRAVNAAGKTAYLVPHALGAMSDPDREKPLTFGDILDGSSNTILLAVVAPEHAQIWTKPADWELDYNNPLEKLQVDGREFLSLVALADGSIQTLPSGIPPKTLSALITIAGGEVAFIPEN